MPFIIRSTIRIAAANEEVATLPAYIGAVRQLRRDPDPEAPYIRQFTVASMAHSPESARLWASRTEAAAICDNLIGPGAAGAEVVEIAA
jgi:hypothetical protein